MAAEDAIYFKDAARIQLEKAIELFLFEHDFLCSATLAGAAEDVLGNALEAQNPKAKHELNWLIRGIFNFREGVYQDEKNRILFFKNWLKHYAPAHHRIELNTRAAASDIICRAIENWYQLTNEETPLMEQFLREEMGIEPEFPDLKSVD